MSRFAMAIIITCTFAATAHAQRASSKEVRELLECAAYMEAATTTFNREFKVIPQEGIDRTMATVDFFTAVAIAIARKDSEVSSNAPSTLDVLTELRVLKRNYGELARDANGAAALVSVLGAKCINIERQIEELKRSFRRDLK